MTTADEQRPDPETLLRRLGGDAEGTRRTGDLKIFFGYAAGVGKTYAMLQAAHQARAAGVDVVVGYVEPHARPDTLALLEGLEALPPRAVRYRGITLREFDLDAALRRRPRLLLVDELAHTNAEGSRHLKRYQDIEELLWAGIDVYTTLNVQHLEGLHDRIAAITGIPVSERIPDRVFDLADQVEVIDIEPADLMNRLRGGKIYALRQAGRALANFFTGDRLAALREIALRRTADRLSGAARRDAQPTAAEHVLVCLSGAPSNARVIRAAARMAEAFRAAFTGLLVEPPEEGRAPGAEPSETLRANLRLAERFGARVATVAGLDIAAQIAEYAMAGGVTKIVVGRSGGWMPLRKSLVDRLVARAPGIEVYVIPDRRIGPRGRGWRRLRLPRVRFAWRDPLWTLGALVAASALGWGGWLLGLRDADIIPFYLLAVLAVAVLTSGWLWASLAALLGVGAFNFLFTVPRFTLRATDPGYPVTFAVMFVVGVVAGSLMRRLRAQGREAARRAYRTEVLMGTACRLREAEGVGGILAAAAEQLTKVAEMPAIVYPCGRSGDALLAPRVYPPESRLLCEGSLGAEEAAVAEWVRANGRPAGRGTDTLPGAKCRCLPVRGRTNTFAVVALPVQRFGQPSESQRGLATAILDECGLLLEREALRREKARAELAARQETLRANLLRAISHDLRSPLTGILGASGMLLARGGELPPDRRRGLCEGIRDDAAWLLAVVENLLAVSRLSDGAGVLALKRAPELVDELFGEALRHLDGHAAEHTITLGACDPVLMVSVDARLAVLVVVNLVNNAIKYTPKGSHIHLSALRRGAMAELTVADDGPGIPDGEKERVFEMFRTVGGTPGDGRRGLGLGLALCRSIVAAHGGTLAVRDHPPHGAAFVFTLPVAEPPQEPLPQGKA